jgi:hypothetical protein
MDEAFEKKIVEFFKNDPIIVGKNVIFKEEDEVLSVELRGENGNSYTHVLKKIKELYEGDGFFVSSPSKWEEKYLPLVLCIESEINSYYDEHEDLKDKTVISLLERLLLSPDMKPSGELDHLIKKNLRLCLSMNGYSKKEFDGTINKILKSVKIHHKSDGARGYLDFISGKYDPKNYS